MPDKIDRCVSDVKGQGKDSDSAWAICNDSIKEEVAAATGITALARAGVGLQEDHNPMDIPFGFEVNQESVSIPSSASNLTISADKKKIEEIGDNVIKQLLETQIGECPCKNKSRPKA